jgi:hypothetical protein
MHNWNYCVVVLCLIVLLSRLQLSVLEGKYTTLKTLNRQLLTATNTYESILRKRDKHSSTAYT